MRQLIERVVVAGALLVACGKVHDPSNQPSAAGGTGGTAAGEAQSASAESGGWAFGGTAGAQAFFPCDEGSTHVGDVTLETMDDVIGLAGISQVDGSLHILGHATDLRPLHCLQRITGGLFIYETRGLKNLDGLDGVTTIEDGLYVGLHCNTSQPNCIGNRDLETVVLPQLEHAKEVQIGAVCGGEGNPTCGPNSALASVRLQRLTEVGNIEMESNPSLVDVHFDSVTQLTSLSLVHHESLRTISMPRLGSIEALKIRSAPALDEFFLEELEEARDISLSSTGFVDLSWLNSPALGSLSLIGNSHLVSLHGLEGVEEANELHLEANPALSSLVGVERLQALNELFIYRNPSLSSLEGLESLQTVDTLRLLINEALQSLGFQVEVRRNLEIYRNPELTSLQGITTVSELESVRIADGDQGKLASIGALSGLLVVGSLTISNTSVLSSLEGLEALEHASNVSLDANQSLVDLSALSALESVDGILAIAGNPELESLEGLGSVKRVKQLKITSNTELKSVDQLSSLAAVEEVFDIRNNSSLATCEAEQLVAQTEHDSALVQISGNDDEGVCTE